MADLTCPHLAALGGWCRLASNLRCPAQAGRVGCPFPAQASFSRRSSERPRPAAPLLPAAQAAAVTTAQKQHQREQVLALLAAAFSETEISWQVLQTTPPSANRQTRALLKPILGHHALLERLDRVVGPANWHDQYEITSDDGGQYQAKCRLTILAIAKEDVGSGPDRKTATIEALHNAAIKFGIGRSLAQVMETWVDFDLASQRPLMTPTLPAFALATAPATATPPALPTPKAEAVLIELLGKVRTLPGGEGLIRRLVGPRSVSERSLSEKRQLYSALNRVYHELSGT
jgi:hypothetical protein